ncbi:uncharacterized protein EI97DRAFT_3659 [Westerdykella ornata]|uniref:Uncharacterized protein n=1 Tax=Westerdykella ornata TaxID=318751 RepID=A0A6A6JY07_WESOR|nr:uncharacterized protein EI97DRAFT_3659 [Westerdykella ornata]KAF2280636.1 hypothetical protein EI97DRAFT_3659 [Westerdykella ornata]
MPSVVQTQTLNNGSIGFLLKDNPPEPVVAGFTAVNGRATPPSPPRLNPINGMAPACPHMVSYSHHSTGTPQEQRPLPSSEHWQSVPSAPQSKHSSTSPILVDGERSSHSPIKRKRSVSGEDDRSTSSPIPSPQQTRRRVGSYPSPETSPPMASSATMDQQQRTLPPISQAVAGHDKKWSVAEVEASKPVPYQDPQEPHPTPHYQTPGPATIDHSQQTSQVSSTTEITRAGVQVDPKKRKRVSSF